MAGDCMTISKRLGFVPLLQLSPHNRLPRLLASDYPANGVKSRKNSCSLRLTTEFQNLCQLFVISWLSVWEPRSH